MDFDILSSKIEDNIRSAGGEIIRSIKLFDVYSGKQIPEGKKSLAYSIEYNSASRTLTDSEVDEVHSQIIHRLSEEFGIELRK